MLSNSLFKKNIPLASSDLPVLTLISLETWVLIKLQGIDSIQYLHNQLTCDIKHLSHYQYSFAAHCNVQGKMIANMYVFFLKNQEIAYIESKSISKKQIVEMKKYAIFSNVVITPDHDAYIIGVVGLHAKKYLNIFFKILPDQKNTVIHHQNITIMYFHLPIERFLLIIKNRLLLTKLLNKSQLFSAQYNNYYQWVALDIEAGYPHIDSETSELFFPQAANIDILNGISFKKGCFLGQEIIARIQYRKLNKQSLYHLLGKLNQNQNTVQLPKSGDQITLQIDNQYWKKIGTVLQSCQIKENLIWIQAILNKSIFNANPSCIQNAKIGHNNNLNISFIN